jgi:hypothetical protein
MTSGDSGPVSVADRGTQGQGQRSAAGAAGSVQRQLSASRGRGQRSGAASRCVTAAWPPPGRSENGERSCREGRAGRKGALVIARRSVVRPSWRKGTADRGEIASTTGGSPTPRPRRSTATCPDRGVPCSVPGPTLNVCGYRDGRPTLLSPRGVSPGTGRAVIRAGAGHDPRVLLSVPGPTLNLRDLRDGRRAVVSPWSVRPGTAQPPIPNAVI